MADANLFSNLQPGFPSVFLIHPERCHIIVQPFLVSPSLPAASFLWESLWALWVLPPLRAALRALWGRCGGPGAQRLLVPVPVEGQEFSLLLDVFLCLQLLQGDLGWEYFH